MIARSARSLAVVAGCVGLLTLGFASAKPVSASKWVKSFCTADFAWQDSLVSASGPDGFEGLQSALAGEEADLTAARSTVVEFFDGAMSATKTLKAKLKKAGVPEIPNGAKIVKAITKEIGSVQKLLSDGAEKAAALSTSDADAFTTAGADIFSDIEHVRLLNPDTADKIETLDTGHKVAAGLTSCRRV